MHILNKREVAELLGLTESTLSTSMVRNPDSVPPWFKRPGGRSPLWFKETVDAFLIRCATGAGAMPSDVPSQPQKR